MRSKMSSVNLQRYLHCVGSFIVAIECICEIQFKLIFSFYFSNLFFSLCCMFIFKCIQFKTASLSNRYFV